MTEPVDPTTPEPETPEAYWARMAAASTAGADPTTGHIASVSCTNTACDRKGTWYQVPATQDGPLHCGGCYAVLYCLHAVTVSVTVWAGTVGAPLMRESTSCVACHHVVASSQTPVAPGDVPLSLLQTVHSA